MHAYAAERGKLTERRCLAFGCWRKFPYMGILTAMASEHGGAAKGSGGKYPDVRCMILD